jgi:hypothetical protein
MAQAAFEFSIAANPANNLPSAPWDNASLAGSRAQDGWPAHHDSTGFELGRDHARHGVMPPLRHLHDHNPIRQGWETGRALFHTRVAKPTAAHHQWLALRLQAWQHGWQFEEVQVNPAFLTRIAVRICPVTRQALTLSADLPSDATVSRLNHEAAYAAGNLAVLSRQADMLQANMTWSEALAQVQRIEAGPSATVQALDKAAWMRMAVLASFATPLSHGQAAELPLCVLPPNRVRVINPIQALQVALSLQFCEGGYARRLLGWAALMPNGETRQAFQIFMHTLLARRLAVGASANAETTRKALEDSWTDTLILRRWQRLATRLSAKDCDVLLQRASQRQLLVGGGHWISNECATEGWAMPAPGGCSRAAGQAAKTSPRARPGKALSLGSQKLAN